MPKNISKKNGAKDSESLAKQFTTEELNTMIESKASQDDKDLKNINDRILRDKESIINGQHTFIEKFNTVILQYLIENYKSFKDDILRDNKNIDKNDRYDYDPLKLMKKYYANSYQTEELIGTEYALVKVNYQKGKTSFGIGREYAKFSIGIQSLPRYIRSAICFDSYTDIDQINSHPHLLKLLFDKHGLNSSMLNENISNRDEFLLKINPNKEKAKTKVIAMINGGKPTSSDEYLLKYKNEIDPLISTICKLEEYKHIRKSIKEFYKDDIANKKDVNIKGKCISKILQIKENDLLVAYIEWAGKHGFLGKTNNNVALIFDGLQILKEYNITDEHLRSCEEYAFNKTGYNIPLKIKPFECKLIIPHNYYDLLIGDNIDGFVKFISYKVNDEFIKDNADDIDNALQSLAHYDVIKVIACIVKDRVYNEGDRHWYYCDPRNIWREHDKPYVLMALIPIVGIQIFKKRIGQWAVEYTKYRELVKEHNKEEDYIELKVLEKKIEKGAKLTNHLKLAPYTKSLLSYTTIFLKEKFSEDYLDNKAHLFAFRNKIFDFNLKPDKLDCDLGIDDFMRPIKPTDYISTTTGYDYIDLYDTNNDTYNIDDVKFIENFFDTIFPVINTIDPDTGFDIPIHKGLRDYVIKSIATSFNGSNKEQSVYFHTGKGSNGKTTLFGLIEKALGDYYGIVSAETFTEKMRSNGNNEVYRYARKRVVSFSEPDDSPGVQIQTPMIKLLGEVNEQKIRGKKLYQQEYYFKNQATTMGLMNNQPMMSTVDLGAARRLKSISYVIRFVENPIERHERKLDPSFIFDIKKDKYKHAFINFILNTWIKDVRPFNQIEVPQCVIDSSNQYCNDCNSVLKFIRENYTITGNSADRIPSNKLYKYYMIFMKRYTSEVALSDKKFKENLLNIKGIQTKHIATGCVFLYLKWNEDITQEEKDANVVFHPDSDSEEPAGSKQVIITQHPADVDAPTACNRLSTDSF